MAAPSGLIIWVCEGTKRNHRQVEAINEDPQVIREFLAYLRAQGIDETRLRARVQCSGKNVEHETKKWSKITGIPVFQFTKPIIKRGKGRRESSSLIIRYSSAELKRRIEAEARSYGFLSCPLRQCAGMAEQGRTQRA